MAHFPLHHQVHFPKLPTELDLHKWDAYEKLHGTNEAPNITLVFNEPSEATIMLKDHEPTGIRDTDNTSIVLINRGADLTLRLQDSDIAPIYTGGEQKLVDRSCVITKNEIVLVRHFGHSGGWSVDGIGQYGSAALVADPMHFELHQFDLLPVLLGVIPTVHTGYIHFSADWPGSKTLELWVDGLKFYKWLNVDSGVHVLDYTMTQTHLQSLQRGRRETYMAKLELRTSDRIHWTGGLRVDIPDLAIFAPPSNSPPQ